MAVNDWKSIIFLLKKTAAKAINTWDLEMVIDI